MTELCPHRAHPLIVLAFLLLSAVACFAQANAPATAPPDPTPARTPPASGHLFFEDGFESGNFSKWDEAFNLADGSLSINSDPGFVDTGKYSVGIHYRIPKEEPPHQDKNRFFAKYIPEPKAVFVKGRVYFKTPEPGGSKNVSRKLLYLLAPPDAQGQNVWAVVLGSTYEPGNDRLLLYVSVINHVVGGQGLNFTTPVYLKFDRWYTVQFEVTANAPASRDGRLALYVNGALAWSQDRLNLRHADRHGINKVQVGDQVDRAYSLPVDEHRYWDNVSIADYYMP